MYKPEVTMFLKKIIVHTAYITVWADGLRFTLPWGYP